MYPSNKKKKKRIKYKKFEFKLSEKQKIIIDKFCLAKKTSPNKMIKSAIRDYIEKFADTLPEQEFISKNQLKLFEMEEEQVSYNKSQPNKPFEPTLV